MELEQNKLMVFIPLSFNMHVKHDLFVFTFTTAVVWLL